MIQIETSEFENLLRQNTIPANASILNVSRDPDRTTDRYKETDDVAALKHMNDHNWFISEYRQVKAQQRNSAKQIYKPYVAIFKNPTLPPLEGEGHLTILQRNAKDGTKCHEAYVGFFRMACANQLTVGNILFSPVHIKHVGNQTKVLDDLISQVLDITPKVYGLILDMKDRQLTTDEQAEFAKEAAILRFEDPNSVKVEELLATRRAADAGASLWNVTNRIQENLIRPFDTMKVIGVDGKARKARQVTNIDLNFKINNGIWNLAEKFLTVQ